MRGVNLLHHSTSKIFSFVPLVFLFFCKFVTYFGSIVFFLDPYFSLMRTYMIVDFLWQISSYLFDYSWRLWQSDIQTILHAFSTLSRNINSNALEKQQDELYLKCERWLLGSKIIRQLVIFGFASDAKSVQVIIYFSYFIFFPHCLLGFRGNFFFN